MTKPLHQFFNCRILKNHKIIYENLWIRDGKIVSPENVFFDEKTVADLKIDCKGALIAPGFIDVQINGGFGIDFSDDTIDIEQGILIVAKNLLTYGVTSFCPTIVTSPAHVYRKILPKIHKHSGGVSGATVLGVHVEGPFINKDKKGAHPTDFILKFEKGFTTVQETYRHLDNIKIVTLAPELKHSSEVIKELTSRGIIVSLGHSAADLKEGEAAIMSGATFITHLFNAMIPFHHRDPGLIGLLTSDSIPKNKTVYYGIIADGHHTDPAALKIAYRSHPNGLILVTDAISALGLEDGKHYLGQLAVEVSRGMAIVEGTDTLAGSIVTMIRCIQLFKEATGCSLEYVLEAASLHPALLLGIANRKGTLNYGSDADFVLLSDDLDVISTYIAGECVYKS